MKPLRLVMSGFGSYGGQETVDFTAADHGIFLITGDTGAGKTTIFDGIMFALYDQTSGGKRDGNMMRSQYALPSTPTYVEFTFQYGKREYRIKRNPEYQREKKRKAADGMPGFTAERAAVELTLPDGSIFMGKKPEVNKKIEEIMGLDARQFTQIAMIAQGEFLKLLHAQSQERKLIFSKIFNTRIYWVIQEKLKEQAKIYSEKLVGNEKDFKREAAYICRPVEPECADMAEELKQGVEIDRAKEIVDAFIVFGEAAAKEIFGQWEEKKGELAAALRTLDLAESRNQLFAQLHKAREKRVGQRNLEERFACIKERLAKGRKAQSVALREAQYQEQKAARQRTAEEVVHIEKWIRTRETPLKQAENTAVLAEQSYKEAAPKLHADMDRIKSFTTDYQELVKKKKDLNLKYQEAEWKKAQEQYEKSSRAYDNLYEAYIAGAAGILAEQLAEGAPCPVCGAVSHPDKARLSQQVPSKDQLDQIKIERERCKAAKDLADEKYKQALELTYEVQALEKKLPYPTIEEAKRIYNKAKEQLRILEENEKKSREQFQKLQEDMLQKEGKQRALMENEGRLQKDEHRSYEVYQKELTEAGFIDEEDYQRWKLPVKEGRMMEQELHNFEEEVIRTQEAIRLYESQTEGKEPIQADDLPVKILELNQLLLKLEQKKQFLASQNMRNQEIKKSLADIHRRRLELKEQYQIAATLSKTANGTLNQSIKLDFETYIQRQFFKQIIRLANQRFVRMTSNQLILRCRDIKDLGTQGQAGLDLDVYSPVTNSTRDVKTLSGGESFLAALAMALGLADVIQNTAGAIKLDTMFIDEGFGSLDDEAREQAIQILNELAGEERLVGIISHVTELKEQIDLKLVVERSETGSRLGWKV